MSRNKKERKTVHKKGKRINRKFTIMAQATERIYWKDIATTEVNCYPIIRHKFHCSNLCDTREKERLFVHPPCICVYMCLLLYIYCKKVIIQINCILDITLNINIEVLSRTSLKIHKFCDFNPFNFLFSSRCCCCCCSCCCCTISIV